MDYDYPVVSMEWQKDAACIGSNLNFFPGQGAETEKAIREIRGLCNRCPVRRECLVMAVTMPANYGIWAGTTPGERRSMRRIWQRTGRIETR